jgi:hypothetical protein
MEMAMNPKTEIPNTWLPEERPALKGLSVPGMPLGSRAMEGPRKNAYQVDLRRAGPFHSLCKPLAGSNLHRLFMNIWLLFLFATLALPALAHTPPADARVFFVDLQDGAVVHSPFKVHFGIEGFGITPAGTTGKIRHRAGHFHLLVDLDQPPDLDNPIPRDSQHLHFDQGETDATLTLPPGRHSLQLLLGDEAHEPHDPPLISQKITLTVE